MSQINGLRTIRQQIADSLRASVIAGDYQPGDPLREVELAERFGVSRGPVRDALLQLTQEGLLVHQRNSGARVGLPPTPETRELIVGLRRQLETYVVRTRFEAFTDEDRARVKRALMGLRAACEAADAGAIVEADVAFHQGIVEAGGQSDLMPIWTLMCASMRFEYSRLDDHMQIYAEHEAIVSAMESGEKQAMIKALEANLI